MYTEFFKENIGNIGTWYGSVGTRFSLIPETR